MTLIGGATEVVELDDLKAEAFVGHSVLIRFDGVMREQHPEDWLAPFLVRVAELVGERSEVVVDISSLSFMNATAFRVMLPWLRELGDRTPPCRVQLRIKAGIVWQEVAVSALKAIAGRMITVETVA